MTRKSIFSRPQAKDPPYIHRTDLEDAVRREARDEARKICMFCGATTGYGVTRLLREGWQTELTDQRRREVIAPADLLHDETGAAPQVMADIATRLIRDADALGYDGKRHFREFAAAFLIFHVRLYAGDREELGKIYEWPVTSGERRRERWMKLGVRFATMGLADAFDLAAVVMGDQSDGLVDQVTRYLVDFVDSELTGETISEIENKLYSKILSSNFNAAREAQVDASVTATMLCEQTFEDCLCEFLHGLGKSQLGLGAMVLFDHVYACNRPGGAEPDLSDPAQEAAWVLWTGDTDRADECRKSLAIVLAILDYRPVDASALRTTLGNHGDRIPLTADVDRIGLTRYNVDALACDRVEHMLNNPPEGKEAVAARVRQRLIENGLLPQNGCLMPVVLASVWAREVGDV